MCNLINIHTYIHNAYICSADHEERDWPPSSFFGLATNTLNVKNNDGDKCNVQYSQRWASPRHYVWSHIKQEYGSIM